MSGAGQDTRASSPACGGRRARGLSGAAKALFNAALAVIVICVLICQPYSLSVVGWRIQAQKQEAQAIPAAIPVALEVLNGIATAIGITEIGLSIFNGVGVTASSGYQPYDVEETPISTDMKALPAPSGNGNWPKWRDLSSENQSLWGSEENYRAAYQNQILRDTVFTSDEDVDYFNRMTEYYENGQVGDKPEPGESTKTKMTKIKNGAGQVLAGGLVALPAVMQLYDDISHIFNNDSTQDLGVPYTQEFQIDGYPSIKVATGETITRNGVEYSADKAVGLNNNGGYFSNYYRTSNPYAPVQVNYTNGDWHIDSSSSAHSGVSLGYKNGSVIFSNVANVFTAFAGSSKVLSNEHAYLNSLFNYYEFQVEGQTLTEQPTVTQNFDTLPETPDDLKKAVPNAVAYNNYINNLNNNVPDGMSWGVGLPTGGINPDTTYPELTSLQPSAQVKEDLDTPSDDPQNPNEEPLDPEENDLKTRVMNALNAPFAAIFPFCLLDDCKRMFFIFANHGATGEYDYLRFDISGYGVSSEQYFVIDLHGLKDLGNTVRWIFNLMLAALLLRAAYRFFVEQSGGD